MAVRVALRFAVRVAMCVAVGGAVGKYMQLNHESNTRAAKQCA